MPSKRKLSRKKKWAFGLVAVSIGLAPLLLLELILILAGWNIAAEISDPFIGLSGDQKLFELNESATELRIRDDRYDFFRPAKFPREKQANTFRVFVIGGSTVQGRPWENETAFPKWLEICIASNLPDQTVEVVNCGGVSYASYRLSHIVKEVAMYQPDLLIVCTGHNEFLEDRTYEFEKKLSPVFVSTHQVLSKLRSYQWLRSAVLRIRASENGPKSELDENVITRLDYEKGLAKFTSRSIQRKQVEQHFRFNLSKMISIARKNEIPIMLVAPPANQKSCFPFKPNDSWSVDSKSKYANYDSADFEQEIAENSDADFCFFYAVQLFESGRHSGAKEFFDRAIDEDICPLRMTRTLRELMRGTANDAIQKTSGDQVLFLDLQKEFEAISQHNIVGNETLVDHVHPTIAANQLIAQLITKQLLRAGVISHHPEWEIDIVDQFENVIRSLDFGYFDRGKVRLESVLKWSRGQAVMPLKDSLQLDKGDSK